MKRNSKPEVTFPLTAFLKMAEDFFFFLISYFSFNQNQCGLKLNTWHVGFQHKWIELGRAACKRRACNKAAWWSPLEKPSFFHAEELTDILSPWWLSQCTWKLGKLTKLPKNWSGQSQSLPTSKRWKRTVWHLSRYSLRLHWWNCQQILKVSFFPLVHLHVRVPESESWERFLMYFWGFWL